MLRVTVDKINVYYPKDFCMEDSGYFTYSLQLEETNDLGNLSKTENDPKRIRWEDGSCEIHTSCEFFIVDKRLENLNLSAQDKLFSMLRKKLNEYRYINEALVTKTLSEILIEIKPEPKPKSQRKYSCCDWFFFKTSKEYSSQENLIDDKKKKFKLL